MSRIGLYSRPRQIFIVTYDLADSKNRREDYDRIAEILQTFGSATPLHIQESVWLLASRMSSEAIRDQLMDEMREDDKAFVGELQEMASFNLHERSYALFEQTWPK